MPGTTAEQELDIGRDAQLDKVPPSVPGMEESDDALKTFFYPRPTQPQ